MRYLGVSFSRKTGSAICRARYARRPSPTGRGAGAEANANSSWRPRGRSVRPGRPARARRACARQRKGTIAARQDPRRRALEEVELLPTADLGHELDRGRAGADDRHLPAGEVVVVSQRAEWNVGREALEAGQLRDGRLAQRADGRHEHVRAVDAAAGLDPPAPLGFLPGDLGPRGRAAYAGGPEALDAIAQVSEDLRLGRIGAAPARVGRERELIKVRLHVARAAGIGVVAPHAADLIGALEDEEVVDPLLRSRMAAPIPANPAPAMAT